MMVVAEDLSSGTDLRDLLQGLVAVPARHRRRVTGIAVDSREVMPGDLFLARAGSHGDPRRHVDLALARGAVAVVYESDAVEITERNGVPLISLADMGKGMGRLAARFFGDPSSTLWLAGVTGTNGKTSVSHYLAQALEQDGGCGLLGTLGYGRYGYLRRGLHTTPDAVTVQRYLAGFRDQGLNQAVMEVSSHALVQGRVAGLRFDVAVFTNLSRDHLDYHGDMAAYADAKRSLFLTPGLVHAVLNLDDPEGRVIRDALPRGVQAMGYSLSPGARESKVRALEVNAGLTGLRVRVATPQGEGVLESRLLGTFNVANLLAALGVLLAREMPLAECLERLTRVAPVPGRMERFGGGAGPLVVVDYAHTPDALAQALGSLRPHTVGRVHCVFGCGGDRDRGKRPQMGRVAETLADELFITDDNPRHEAPETIVTDILAGLRYPQRARVEHHRAKAIEAAVSLAAPGDVVLVAGKGHEDYQEVAGERRAYSDRALVRGLTGGGGA